MADPAPFPPAHSGVDPERAKPDNAFDAGDGYSGQDYAIERERTEGRKHPGGHSPHDNPADPPDITTEDERDDV